MNTILLTGGTGFIGSFLLEELVKRYKIILLKRSFSNTDKIIEALRLTNVISCDIDVYGFSLADIFEANEIDAVIHTATSYGRRGELPSEIVQSALLLPMQLLEQSLSYGVNTFISTDSYFNQVIPLDNKELGYHAEAKRIFLEYAKRMIADKSIKFLNMKIGHAYGPGDDKNKFIPSVILKLLANQDKFDFTPGEQQRNFVYVKDLVGIYMSLLENTNKFGNGLEEFEGWTGEIVTIRQLVEKIKEITGSNTQLDFGALNYRPGEIMTIPGREEKLDKLGRKAQYTIDEGLSETIEYFKTNQ